MIKQEDSSHHIEYLKDTRRCAWIIYPHMDFNYIALYGLIFILHILIWTYNSAETSMPSREPNLKELRIDLQPIKWGLDV